MNGQTTGQAGYGVPPTSSTSQTSTTILDDLLRRALKIGDPRNPQEVAAALLRLYPEDSSAMEREVAGFPFVSLAPVVTMAPMMMSPSDSEFGIASDYLDQDLTILTTSPVLRQIVPEMRGIASAIRAAVAEGVAAARLALDPVQRDKAFATRRILGDYARLARILGALTTEINPQYRRFARSLDQVASLLLVFIGETLARAGFGAGEFILQVPSSDLQARRGGFMMALRALLGSVESAYGDEEYGRGRRGYQLLYDEIEDRNQVDLKPLLTESGLSTVINGLVDAAAGATPDALRGLGATAQITLERLRRLLSVGADVQQRAPEPPLIAFLVALRLFIDAFEVGQSGSRLVTLARPPILFYGAYAQAWPDTRARQRLVDLSLLRSILADLGDCITRCACDVNAVSWQIIFDKILYDLDRAIDLYALGEENFGLPEQRAYAYGTLFDLFLNGSRALQNPVQSKCCALTPQALDSAEPALAIKLATVLSDIKAKLIPLEEGSGGKPPTSPVAVQVSELCAQHAGEARFRELVKSLAPDCAVYEDLYTYLTALIDQAVTNVSKAPSPCPTPDIQVPQTIAASAESVSKDIETMTRKLQDLMCQWETSQRSSTKTKQP